MLQVDKEGRILSDLSRVSQNHDSLSRDTGAGILHMIASATASEPVPILNDFEFIEDSIMCEWAWVVGLDKEVLEAFSNHPTN